MLSRTREADDDVGAVQAWAVDVPDTKDINPLLESVSFFFTDVLLTCV